MDGFSDGLDINNDDYDQMINQGQNMLNSAQASANQAFDMLNQMNVSGMANDAAQFGGNTFNTVSNQMGNVDMSGMANSAQNFGGQAFNTVSTADYSGMANSAQNIGGQAVNTISNADYQGFGEDAKNAASTVGGHASRLANSSTARENTVAQAENYGRSGQAQNALENAADDAKDALSNAAEDGQRIARNTYGQAKQAYNSDQVQDGLADSKEAMANAAEDGMNAARQGGEAALREGKAIYNSDQVQDGLDDAQSAVSNAANAARQGGEAAFREGKAIYNSDEVQNGIADGKAAVGDGLNAARQGGEAAFREGKAIYNSDEVQNGIADGKQFAAQAANEGQRLGEAALREGQRAYNSDEVQNAISEGKTLVNGVWTDVKSNEHIAAALNEGGKVVNAVADSKEGQAVINAVNQGANTAQDGLEQGLNYVQSENFQNDIKHAQGMAEQGAEEIKDGARAAAAYVTSEDFKNDMNAAAGAVEDGAQAASESVEAGVAYLQSEEFQKNAAQAAKQAGQAVEQGAQLAAVGLEEMKVKMEDISNVFKPVSNSVLPALEAAGGTIASAAMDLIKLEIFRDFFQVISLFFEGLKDSMPESFQAFWAKIAAFFSICWSCWVTDFYDANKQSFSIAMFIIEFIICCGVSGAFIYRWWFYRPEARTQGLDVKTWASRGEYEQKWAKYSSLILTSVYLPVFRDVLQVFTCDLKYVGYNNDGSSQCAGATHGFLYVCAIICCVVYLVPVPVIFYKIIQQNKPKINLYDAAGVLRKGEKAYTDADYKADLLKDTSPYKSLYDGYERKWAFYKVIVMILKIALVTPATLFVTSNLLGGRVVGNDEGYVTTKAGPDSSYLGQYGESYSYYVSTTNPLFKERYETGQDLLLVQSFSVLVVLVIYAGAAWTSRPFLDDNDDYLDGISRFCCLTIAVFGVLSWYMTESAEAFGLILNIITSCAALAMISLFIAQLPPVQTKIKNWRERIDFTMSREDPMTPLVFADDLSLTRERKLRIWHEWWDVLFAQDDRFKLPNQTDEQFKETGVDLVEPKGNKVAPTDANKDEYKPVTLSYSYGDTPPYLLEFKDTVCERHMENKEIAAHESFESYERALFLLSTVNPQFSRYLQTSIRKTQTLYTGLDIYWDGDVEDTPVGDLGHERTRKTKKNTTKTKFGKMYVTPFPFCAAIIMDEDASMALLSFSPVVDGVRRDVVKGMQQFNKFIAQNGSREVVRRRKIRQSIRALHGETVYFEMSAYVTKRIDKKSVKVLMKFQYGVLKVEQATPATWWENPDNGERVNVSHGFDVKLYYSDGEGRYGNEHFTGQEYTADAEELGILADYRPNEKLMRLMGLAGNALGQGNASIVRQQFPKVVNNLQAYREYYLKEFADKRQCLSYAFWYYVYNNHNIDQATLAYVLTTCEQHEVVQRIPLEFKASLDVLYGRLAYFDSHPGIAYWFVFWHDVYLHNRDMECFQSERNKALIDPYSSSSLLYKPLDRPVLEALLKDHGLGGGNQGCLGIKTGYFHSGILDVLYGRLGTTGTIPVVVDAPQDAQLIKDIRGNYAMATGGARGQFFSKGTIGDPKKKGDYKIQANRTAVQQVQIQPQRPSVSATMRQPPPRVQQPQVVSSSNVVAAQVMTTPLQPQMQPPNRARAVSNSQTSRGFQPQQPQVLQPGQVQQRMSQSQNRPQQQQQQPALPAGWVSAWDPNQKRLYYKNTVTHQTQWHPPTAPAQALPYGWVAATDPKTHKTYYKNQVTHQTTWVRPTAPANAQQQPMRPQQQPQFRQQPQQQQQVRVIQNPRVQVQQQGLPPNWIAKVDPRGRTYYENVAMKTTTWTRPTR